MVRAMTAPSPPPASSSDARARAGRGRAAGRRWRVGLRLRVVGESGPSKATGEALIAMNLAVKVIVLVAKRSGFPLCLPATGSARLNWAYSGKRTAKGE